MSLMQTKCVVRSLHSDIASSSLVDVADSASTVGCAGGGRFGLLLCDDQELLAEDA